MKKRNKKISLIIFPGNFLPHTGGLESHVDNFCKYLSRDRDYDITIFTPDVMGARRKEVIYENVKVIRYPAFQLVYNFPFPKFWTSFFLKEFISLYKKDYDVVMTRTMFFTNSTLGMVFAKWRFKRLKLVHVEHASDYSQLKSPIKSFFNKVYMKILGKLLLVSSDQVVAISDGVRDFLRRDFLSEEKIKKIPVIRRGFDEEFVSTIAADPQIRKTYKGKKIIFFVGRLIDGKGVQDFIHALSGLKRDDYVFLVAGDGGYRRELEGQVMRLGIGDRVKFLGATSYKKTISLLKASDIAVNPSHTEGLPTSVLDGFFCGCKILATDVGGTREILEREWGLGRYRLVKAKDIEKMRVQIDFLLDLDKKLDPSLVKNMKKKFSWEEHAKAYKNIFERF